MQVPGPSFMVLAWALPIRAPRAPSGFRVWGLGSRVWCLGFRIWGLGIRVWGLGIRVWGLGFGV